MKKIFYILLLVAITLQGQTTGVNKLKIAANPEKTTAPRVLVQETNGDVGYVPKSSIQTDISGKVDKVTGKGLSTEDYTTAEKSKLAGIAAGAEVNVNADWNATTGDAQILNKPTIPSITGLATETFVNNGLALKANLASPTFTGTVSGITKAMVGLANVDNTTDAAKPVSTATQTALNLKQNLINHLEFNAADLTVWNNGKGNIESNTSFGVGALSSNTTGGNNIANGVNALYSNTTGGNNTANGVNALYSNTTGDDNIANGSGALSSNTTGGNNIANGSGALSSNTTGGNNIAIGIYSGTDAVANITTQSNQIVIGNNMSTNAYIKIGWTVTSDARDKTNFAPVPYGLNFVNSLQPIKYQFRESRTSNVPVGDVKYGFRAQDVLALEGANPVIIDAKDPSNLKYTEGNMIPVLVNAIKELSQKLTALEAEVQILKNK